MCSPHHTAPSPVDHRVVHVPRSPSEASEVYQIGSDIQDDDQRTEKHSQLGCPVTRVHERHDVMFDEAAIVPGSTGKSPQVVLQRRERTEPPVELDGCTPERTGNVDPCDPLPSPCEKAANDDKHDECDVKQHDRVRKQTVPHAVRSPISQVESRKVILGIGTKMQSRV